MYPVILSKAFGCLSHKLLLTEVEHNFHQTRHSLTVIRLSPTTTDCTDYASM